MFFITWHHCKLSVYLSTSDHQKVLYRIYICATYCSHIWICPVDIYKTTYLTSGHHLWRRNAHNVILCLRTQHQWFAGWSLVSQMKEVLSRPPPGSCGGAHVRVSEPAGGLVLRWVLTQEESSIGTYWGQIGAHQTTTDRRACSHWNSGPIMPMYVCIDVVGQWTCQH